LKSAVYGGVDGVINILAVILGGIASNSMPSHILAVGIAALVGDGVGMGLGDYLSAKSEK
jgi:vacuolar iron transporter family protein